MVTSLEPSASYGDAVNKETLELYETFVMLYGFAKAAAPALMESSGMDAVCADTLDAFRVVLNKEAARQAIP